MLLSLLPGMRAKVCAQTLASPLRLPSGLAFDSAGNLYIADADRQQIYRVAPGGVVTVVAGDGTQGFSGDGGPATAATLDRPSALAVASDGTLYIADTGNARVRRIANGTITTAAGTGAQSFTGDGPALSQALCKPAGLAFTPSGALLIADSCNHRLRSLEGGTLSTIAGTGMQGFAGDGGMARAAQLDTPLGLAVTTDGSVFVADSHNNRIRRIQASGLITTVAGTGIRGYGGEGGPALSAALNHPHGLAFDSSGNLLIADADNQRLRVLSAAGILTTLAGADPQGFSADGTAATASQVSQPRAVAVSGGGTPAMADRGNRLVRVVAADGALYTVPTTTPRPALLTLTAQQLTYGSSTVISALATASPAATGTIELFEAAHPVSSNAAAASAILDASHLSAGAHTLTAAYTGDLLHAPAVSQSLPVTVAPLGITAAATPATISYGDSIPITSGTLQGVLPWDFANVSGVFASPAHDFSPPGTYAIAASLTGAASGNYTLLPPSTAGVLTIVPAATATTLAQPAATYAGMPVMLTAAVAPATRGLPTGQVQFFAAGSVIASAKLDGTAHAAASWLSPPAGGQLVTALYSGDSNFFPSSSAVTTIAIQPQSGFGLSSPAPSQTVPAGSSAVYTINALASPAPFSSAVQFSVAGLPAGSKATFAPPSVVPGNAGAMTTLTITTAANSVLLQRAPAVFAATLLLLVMPYGRRRCSLQRCALMAGLCAGLFGMAGCGARTLATAVGHTYSITVTGTGTDLTGAVIAHGMQITLTID